MNEITEDIEQKIILMLKDNESSLMAFRLVYGFMDGDVDGTLKYISGLIKDNNISVIRNKFFIVTHFNYYLYSVVNYVIDMHVHAYRYYNYPFITIHGEAGYFDFEEQPTHEQIVKPFFKELLNN